MTNILSFSFIFLGTFTGTTKIKNLENNIGSLKVKLTEEDLKEISDAVPMAEVAGGRSFQNTDHFLWKFGNTPPNNYFSFYTWMMSILLK